MHWNNMISALHVVMRCGVLVTAVMSLVVMPLQSAAQDEKGQPDRVCSGFVVLASGHAVLSEESQAMTSDEGHKHGDHKMPKIEPKGHQHGDHKGQAVAGHQHQMGHRHGQAIVAGKDDLCVPLGHPEDTTWRAVSQDDTLSVMAESLRGALAHNSRANEGFDITIMQSGGKLALGHFP